MEEKKQGLFARLLSGLTKTRKQLAGGFASVFGLSIIDDDFYEELEEILIMSDIGIHATEDIIDSLKEQVA